MVPLGLYTEVKPPYKAIRKKLSSLYLLIDGIAFKPLNLLCKISIDNFATVLTEVISTSYFFSVVYLNKSIIYHKLFKSNSKYFWDSFLKSQILFSCLVI